MSEPNSIEKYNRLSGVQFERPLSGYVGGAFMQVFRDPGAGARLPNHIRRTLFHCLACQDLSLLEDMGISKWRREFSALCIVADVVLMAAWELLNELVLLAVSALCCEEGAGEYFD